VLNNRLQDYIIVVENAISNSLCDSILEEFKNEEEWVKTSVGGGRIDEKIRTAETIVISYPYVIEKNLKVRQNLDKYVFISAGLAIRKYNEKFPLAKIEEDSGYELLRYKENQFYIQHTDSFKARPRAVSCSFALNDNYEGGEFAFFDRELKYKLKKGSCIMFPSNFMYPHEIMPVTKGTRYSVITWFI
jgi:predicted 2-oxoglutarate/Fe(II)-dependent dioxygenase YbiX